MAHARLRAKREHHENQSLRDVQSGALVKVSVFDEKTGKEVEVWQGKDPTAVGAGMGVSEIALAAPYNSKRVKIYLDSVHVPGAH